MTSGTDESDSIESQPMRFSRKDDVVDALKFQHDLNIFPLLDLTKALRLNCRVKIVRFVELGGPITFFLPKKTVHFSPNHNFHFA